MRQIPERLPGFRWLLAGWGVYTAVWLTLEGSLPRVLMMGVSTTAVSLAYLVQRYGGGRRLPVAAWVGGTAVLGLLLGTGSSVLTLLLMVVKTGLHGHGPEFTLAQINWVWEQLPLWAVIGLLGGGGLGLLWAGLQSPGADT